MKKICNLEWLAGVLDTSGCWSATIAGQDGQSVGSLRLQLSGPHELLVAAQAKAGCGQLTKRSWSVSRSRDIAQLLVGILPHSQVRGRLYRRLLEWPILKQGKKPDEAQRELRRRIADDIGLIDPIGPGARSKKRRRELEQIRKNRRMAHGL